MMTKGTSETSINYLRDKLKGERGHQARKCRALVWWEKSADGQLAPPGQGTPGACDPSHVLVLVICMCTW